MSPDGNRLYFSSQRGQGLGPLGPGILYEVTWPFRGGALAAGPSGVPDPGPVPTTTPTTVPSPLAAPAAGTGRLPATGAGRSPVAVTALTAAAAAVALRRRVEQV